MLDLSKYGRGYFHGNSMKKGCRLALGDLHRESAFWLLIQTTSQFIQLNSFFCRLNIWPLVRIQRWFPIGCQLHCLNCGVAKKYWELYVFIFFNQCVRHSTEIVSLQFVLLQIRKYSHFINTDEEDLQYQVKGRRHLGVNHISNWNDWPYNTEMLLWSRIRQLLSQYALHYLDGNVF